MTKIVTVLQIRNGANYLAGWWANVAAASDEIVALDDGSDDGTVAQLAELDPQIRIARRSDGHAWDEPSNRRMLLQAAFERQARWVLALDVDERLSSSLGESLKTLALECEQAGRSIVQFRLRELWDDMATYRTDGIWGRKTKACFFRARHRDHVHDERALHGEWYSLSDRDSIAPHAGEIYHLNMVSQERRERRYRKFRALDPSHQWQTVGYDYMLDTHGLELARRDDPESYRGETLDQHQLDSETK